VTLPNRDDASRVRSSPFWTIIIAVWLLMISAAITIALALLLWLLVGAF
jgi:hypothetical protein